LPGNILKKKKKSRIFWGFVYLIRSMLAFFVCARCFVSGCFDVRAPTGRIRQIRKFDFHDYYSSFFGLMRTSSTLELNISWWCLRYVSSQNSK
jgi:hypothetical protein